MSADPLDLQQPAGYTTLISNLVAQLTMTKHVITQKVKILSIRQLDAIIPNHANTIGSLLKHMIALEKKIQTIIFLYRDLNKLEENVWLDALAAGMGQGLIKGYAIDYYLHLWEEVRIFTLDHLKMVDDAWLYNLPEGKFAMMGNHYYCIFHFMEDQLCHYGQIRSMIKYIQ